MKINEQYVLNKNLDLKKENFIIKKGTSVKIISLFDEADTALSTKLELKFDKINGSYIMDKTEFKSKIDQQGATLQAQQIYPNGSCVQHQDYGKGNVLDYFSDDILEFYYYRVQFATEIKRVTEENLSPCE